MSNKYRILIVEDEFNLADVIRKSLEKEKYVIDISGDGEDASYNIRSNIDFNGYKLYVNGNAIN